MRKKQFFWILMIVLFALGGTFAAVQGAAPFAPQFSGCGGDYVPVVNAEFEREVVVLVNQERDKRGLPPLKQVSDIDEASRYHAADMAMDSYALHDTYDRIGGKLVRICDTFQRMSFYYTEWLVAGENIAGGQNTPQQVMAEWMESPGHKANILSEDFWEIGVGYYYMQGSQFGEYWVQEFGARLNRYPLVINGEEPTTDTPEVEVYVYGDWNEMRLRNDDGDWSDWRPFTNKSNWTLPNTVGEHTVEAHVRKGNTDTKTRNTITLTTGGDDGGGATATLGGLPSEVFFYYNMSDGSLYPASASVAPLNTGTEEILGWQAASSDSWLLVTPSQGSTPSGVLTLIPSGFDTSAAGTHTATVTITVFNPPSGVEGTPQTVQVTIQMGSSAQERLFMPMIAR
jgi:uncharacterized protein YkwD